MRRRDAKPEEPTQNQNMLNDPIGIMSDLNNFMMIEDLKINEQEEKFIQQTKKNKKNK